MLTRLQTRARPAGRSLAATEERFAWKMLAPTFLVAFGVLVAPLMFSLYLSFQHWDITVLPTRRIWVGLDNYLQLVETPRTYIVLRFTMVYTIFSVGGAALVGTAVALLLNRIKRGRGVFAALLVLPMMMTPIVTGLVWRHMFNPQYGAVNDLLGLDIIWLGQAVSASAAVIIATIWQNSGFVMILVLASLRTQEQDQLEAARVDGAGPWQSFRYITFPYILPTLMVAILIRVLFEFRAFDLIWILTQGGPGGATEALSIMNYRLGFRHFALGPGAALSWIMLALTALINAGFIYVLYRSRRATD